VTTLRALAQSLGLSITTVSRALDGYGDVSPVTRERVERAAKAAGYRPNPVARRLRKGTSDTVALVMPTEPGRFYEPAFVELLSVVGELLARQNLDLMLLAARPGPDELQVYRRIVDGRRADACILVRTRRDDPRVAYFESASFPYICIGRTESSRDYAFVDGAGDAGFAEVTQRMIARGHRRIAHLGGPAALTYAHMRASGWRRAMEGAGLATDLVIEAAADEEGGYLATKTLLAKPQRPDAIIAATDRMALGAISAMAEAGLVAGRDIAVTGHDNVPASSFSTPPLTTMALPVREVGEAIATSVVALAGGAKPGDHTRIFPLLHLPRASSGEGG
jgi:LacI family transcriptional regulator